MKKIGIITLYYNNRNYGGLLQSYALTKFLENQGLDAYQIAFNRDSKKNKPKFKRLINLIAEVGIIGLIKKIYYKIKIKITYLLIPNNQKNKIQESIKKRNEILKKFEKSVKHTEVLSSENIGKLNNFFDTFICGSDQIWKPGVNCDEFFLKFVPNKKNKFSYAASIGRTRLAKSDLKKILDSVKELNYVSLREEESVRLFKKNNIDCSLVLDPTLLLDKKDWLKFSKEYKINGEYIFCYFLGVSRAQRKMVTSFAKNNNLKIVTLPFLSNIPTDIDINFGDEKLYDVSPENFVYLIKNAKYVFTDSFHVSVFSGIFKKNFFVFERKEEKTMNGRIINLLKLFNAQERFINNISNVKDISECYDIYKSKKFNDLKEKSINYIKKALGDKNE